MAAVAAVGAVGGAVVTASPRGFGDGRGGGVEGSRCCVGRSVFRFGDPGFGS